ncbi:MAG: hypothetical protein PHU33_14530 [Bacteroidales bacterium]|nr:hypothetical protein [Bacteroidales bacterium]
MTDNNGTAGSYVTYSRLDILGRVTQVTDAKGRLMTRHFYSIAGQPIHTHNIDSGHRWMLFNTAQKPVHQWDNRSNHIERTYNARQQPLHVLVQENGSTTQLLTEQYTYGDATATQYFRGRLTETRGQEGKTNITAYDFKGNVLSLTTHIGATYNATIDWNTTQAIDKSFIQISSFDAMNRPLTQTAPNQQVTVYTYGKGGLLDSLLVNTIRGITNVAYNARGQRTDVWFANGAKTPLRVRC